MMLWCCAGAFAEARNLVLDVIDRRARGLGESETHCRLDERPLTVRYTMLTISED